jgi:hypothetical protein
MSFIDLIFFNAFSKKTVYYDNPCHAKKISAHLLMECLAKSSALTIRTGYPQTFFSLRLRSFTAKVLWGNLIRLRTEFYVSEAYESIKGRFELPLIVI